MAVTYRARKRAVPYRTRLTGRLIRYNEGLGANTPGPSPFPVIVIPGRMRIARANPESRDSGLALRTPRN